MPAVVFVLVLSLAIPDRAVALCRRDGFPGLVDFLVKRVNWHCVFPIRIAGVRIDPFRNEEDEVDPDTIGRYLPEGADPTSPEDASESRKIFCMCRGGGILPVGVRISFWEPVRVVEVVKDAWCFPFLNVDMDGNIDVSDFEKMSRFRKNGTARNADDDTIEQFWQVHFYIFPVLAALDIITDFVCLENRPASLAYVTEVDPRWDDGFLSLVLTPEALLFANPVAVLACMPDVMATTMHRVIDSLYWCVGQWGTVYPVVGHVHHTDPLAGMALAFARTIFNLHKSFVLFGTVGSRALCKTYPMPIWKKSQYRWQLMFPRRDPKCRALGETSLKWGAFKNPPSPKLNVDNFLIMLWRKRTCCAR